MKQKPTRVHLAVAAIAAVGMLVLPVSPASAESRSSSVSSLAFGCTWKASRPKASGRKAVIHGSVKCAPSGMTTVGRYEVKFQLEEQDTWPNPDDIIYSTPVRSSTYYNRTWTYTSGGIKCSNEVGSEELTTRVLIRRQRTIGGWSSWSAAAESSELKLSC